MQQAYDEAGNLWEVDQQGNPVRLLRPAQQQAPQPRQQVPQVVREAPPPPPQQAPVRTPAGATTEGLKPGFMWADPNNPAAGQVPIPTTGRPTPQRPEITSASYADAVQGFTATMALTKLISDLEDKNLKGPGSTSGVMGFRDFLPNSANQQFNKAAESMRGTVASVLGFTGGQLNNVAEANINLGPFIPSASNYDGTITDTIARLKDLQKQGFQRSIAILGGAIDASGNVVPVPPGFEATPENVEKLLSGQYGQDGPNALTVLRQGGGAQTALPGRGDVGSQMITNPNDIPPELNQEIDQLRARLLSEGNGRLDPQAYAQEVGKLGQKYGLMPEDATGFANSLNQYLDAGGTTIPSGVIPAERLMSATETMTNNLFNNPVGGGVTGLANGLSAGTIEAIAPDQMMAMRDAQPIPMLAGEIGGGVATTVLGGRLAGAAAARYAPRLMQGSQFGRNVAADATYGAIYGQNTQGDPVSGAIIASLGSTAGQGAVRGGSAVVGGIRRTPEAIALREAGVPVSVARQMGPNAARAEDAFQSIPVVGDMIRARQLDSFMGVEQAALRESGEAIGYTPQAGGREGLSELLGTPQQQGAIGNAYDNAVANQRFTPDAPFNQTIDDAYTAAGALPPDLAARATLALDNRLGQLRGAPQITGEQFQQSRRGLKSYKAETTKAGFEEDYRAVINKGISALDDLVARQGSPDVLTNLRNADTSYRSAKTLEKAMNSAAGGSQTGEIFLPTPNQLQRAGQNTAARFPGERPFGELADNAQTVLGSKLPNSGTADRQFAGYGLLGLGGAAGGALGYDEQNAVAGTGGGSLLGAAATGGLLALGGRRGSQEALEKLLFERPEVFREIAELASRKGSGLLGTGSAIYGQQYGY